MDFPDPVIEIAVEPKTKSDQEKMGHSSWLVWLPKILHFVLKPTMKLDKQLLRVWASFTLEILVDRMRREFKVDADIGQPQVAYRETISKLADVDYTHKKQTGGSGQFARVKIKFEPSTSWFGL